MGCDGGTIPRRDELVKVKKKPEAKDKDAELAFQWQCCSITQQVLQKPIVMCGYGRLYNKMSLVEALLDRNILPESARHIKSLKDVKDLKLTPNPIYKGVEDKKEGSVDNRAAPFICPMTGIEMSGKFKFIALWSCGCVFSEKVHKEITTKNCHKCQKPFTEEDVVILNASEDDLELMKVRTNYRKQQQKKNKSKTKLESEVKNEVIEIKTENNDTTTSGTGDQIPSTSSTSTSNTASTSNNKDVVNENGKNSTLTKQKSKTQPVKRAAINGSLGPPDNRAKKVKSDYSVAKDPQVSDVYKSLFTSHKSEKEQNRAHWVTYNPFYN